MTDMIFWRCRPYNSGPDVRTPGGLTDGRTGMYQMSFDDWTNGSTSLTNYDLGPLQNTGESNATAFTPDQYSTSQAPTQGAANGSGARGNGDVNWSPQFAYRSRFYSIYVLAHGLKSGADGKQQSLGERRLEAVYDALQDEILWQRSPVSDKRALGD